MSNRQLVATRRARRISPTPPPIDLTDDRDRDVRIRPYRDGDFESVATMYEEFDPSMRAQGIPPIGPDAVRDWLAGILEGVDVVALDGDRVVGHVTFVPDGPDRHELGIFVHQDYQRAGIGTALLAAGLGRAERRGVMDVQLTVQSRKEAIQRLFCRAGFSTIESGELTQRMARRL